MDFKKAENRIKSIYAYSLKGDNYPYCEKILIEIYHEMKNISLTTEDLAVVMQALNYIAIVMGYIQEFSEKQKQLAKSVSYAQAEEKTLNLIKECEDYSKGNGSVIVNEQTMQKEMKKLFDDIEELFEMQFSLDENNPDKAISSILAAMDRQKEKEKQRIYEEIMEANKNKSSEGLRIVKLFLGLILLLGLFLVVVTKFIVIPMILHSKSNTHMEEIKNKFGEEIADVFKQKYQQL